MNHYKIPLNHHKIPLNHYTRGYILLYPISLAPFRGFRSPPGGFCPSPAVMLTGLLWKSMKPPRSPRDGSKWGYKRIYPSKTMGLNGTYNKQYDINKYIYIDIYIYINDIWVWLKLVCTTKNGNFDKKHDNTNNTQLILQVPYLQIKLYTIIATCWV